MRAHVYALAYKSKMFYTLNGTQLRNCFGSERFKNKKVSSNEIMEDTCFFDTIVLNLPIFYHENI
jgi:hypothetical protein